jgi:hypothetical protein
MGHDFVDRPKIAAAALPELNRSRKLPRFDKAAQMPSSVPDTHFDEAGEIHNAAIVH